MDAAGHQIADEHDPVDNPVRHEPLAPVDGNDSAPSTDAARTAELRTPLQGILGLAELMLDDDLSPTQRTRLLRLQDAGEHLLAMLEDTRGQHAGSRARFRLSGAVDRVVSAYAPAAHDKAITIEGSTSGYDGLLVGDGAQLRRVLHHLVDNAVRCTSKGSVTVAATTTRTAAARCVVRLLVTDTGSGMSPTLRDRISTPGTSTDDPRWSAATAGLGLAICRQIVDRMDGVFELTSNPVGGTIASVSVDLQPATRGYVPDVAIGGMPASAVSVPDAMPRRVLLVEDDDINQMVARGMLERLGCTVNIASDGIEAIDELRRDTYDVVLMDCGLPRLDGYDTTQHIRSLENGARHTPIIAMTGAAHDRDRDRCFAAGMDDHLAKPVSIETLADALHRVGIASHSPSSNRSAVTQA